MLQIKSSISTFRKVVKVVNENKWFIKWLGYVKVRIEGRGAERFVNECVRRNLLVWDVKKIADETLVFVCCYAM